MADTRGPRGWVVVAVVVLVIEGIVNGVFALVLNVASNTTTRWPWGLEVAHRHPWGAAVVLAGLVAGSAGIAWLGLERLARQRAAAGPPAGRG